MERKLEKIKSTLGRNKQGCGHWDEVPQIHELLVDKFNFTPFPISTPSQDFMCLYRQNCGKRLRTYLIYVLVHEIRDKKSCIKKLYSVNDDGVFPNLMPIVLLLRSGDYYIVWDYQALYVDKDVRGVVGEKKHKWIIAALQEKVLPSLHGLVLQ